MEMHPRNLPVYKTFELSDMVDAVHAVDEMVEAGFAGRDRGYRVLMPKDKKTAQRMGYAVTTGVSSGLRQRGMHRNIKYWTYHHDADHYGIVLVDSALAERFGM